MMVSIGWPEDAAVGKTGQFCSPYPSSIERDTALLYIYIFFVLSIIPPFVCVWWPACAHTHTHVCHGMAWLHWDHMIRLVARHEKPDASGVETTATSQKQQHEDEAMEIGVRGYKKQKKNTYRKGYWAAHGPLQSCFGFDGRSAVTTTHHLTGQLLFILLCAVVCVLAVFHVQNTKNGSYVELWGATSSTPPAISHNDPSIQTRETTINFIVFYSWLVALRCISRFKIRFMMQTMFSFFLFHLVLQIVCAVARNFVFREMTINTFWTATKLTDTMAKLAISILTVSLRGCNSLQKSSFWSSSSSSICMAIYLGFYSIFFCCSTIFLIFATSLSDQSERWREEETKQYRKMHCRFSVGIYENLMKDFSCSFSLSKYFYLYNI